MMTPVSAATPASAMNPTATATERLKPSHHMSQNPPTRANGTDSMTIKRLGDAPEVQVKQQEDDQQSHWHDDLEPRLGALQIFELAAPGGVITRRKLHLTCNRLLRVGHIAAEVAVAQIDIEVSHELRILCADA